jgi:hypothetical protein
MKRLLLYVSVALVGLSAAAYAEDGSGKATDHPGYVDIDKLVHFGKSESEVEVYLTEPLLRLVAAASKKKDKGLVDALKGLKLIQVRTFSMKERYIQDVGAAADSLVDVLEQDGLVTVVKVREDDEDVRVCFRPNGDLLDGIFVIAAERGDEIALVNIVGTLDPAHIGSVGSNFNLGHLKNLNIPDRIRQEDEKSDEASGDAAP